MMKKIGIIDAGKLALIGLLLVCMIVHAFTSGKTYGEMYSSAKNKKYDVGVKEPTSLYSISNINLLAKLIMAENGGAKNDECLVLTGVVVLKRVKSKQYPNTIKEVIYQKGQYSTAKNLNKINPNERALEIAEELLIYGVEEYPDNLVFQSMFKQGKRVYKKIGTEYFCLA